MSIDQRYDFMFYFDVTDGNPNGDPDADNMPRTDPEDGHGLVTDVCIKRKIRNFIQLNCLDQEGMDIFIKEKAILNESINDAFAEANEGEEIKGAAKQAAVSRARDLMCSRYYDVRTFGAVMSTGDNAGQVRGPIQLTFSRSVDPVLSLDHTITRMAVATGEEAKKQDGDNRTMGRKATIPYGLYRGHGFISASLAKQTGFSQEDLDLFWKAFVNMFEDDRSAARGLMTVRNLIIFEHGNELGSAPAGTLFERVKCERKNEGPARVFSDYEISLDGEPIKNLVERVKVG
ncbi:MAG: type I-C CRISPR-associated protein Cas7/Csd2 [Raoultibacter sp.]|jgi:CRISPR-associated protein Csd2